MMNQTTLPTGSCEWTVTETSETAVCDLVQRILTESAPSQHQPERRRHKRHPFPSLVTLTPIDPQEIRQVDEPLVVVGKNLALRGLDFYHNEPIPCRRAIISFDEMPWEVHLVLLVSWCRFLRPGWYDSGGRFTHIIMPGGNSLEAADVVELD